MCVVDTAAQRTATMKEWSGGLHDLLSGMFVGGEGVHNLKYNRRNESMNLVQFANRIDI